MTTTPNPPAGPDDEVERRLAALKAGADPASLGPAPRSPGVDPGPPGEPALVGDVVGDDGRAWASRAGAARDRADGGRDPGPRTGPGATPPGNGIRLVSWGIDQAGAGRLGLWIGLALVAFGGYLVLAEFVPGVATIGSGALALLGAVLVGWHVTGQAGAWAVHLGVILAGFGGARLVADLAGLPSAGWGTLVAGIGLLLIAAVRVRRREGLRWQAWIGGGLALFGGWGVLGATIPGFPTLGDLVVPLVLVLLGAVVLRRGLRQGPTP